jgi:hypothetical protein
VECGCARQGRSGGAGGAAQRRRHANLGYFKHRLGTGKRALKLGLRKLRKRCVASSCGVAGAYTGLVTKGRRCSFLYFMAQGCYCIFHKIAPQTPANFSADLFPPLPLTPSNPSPPPLALARSTCATWWGAGRAPTRERSPLRGSSRYVDFCKGLGDGGAHGLASKAHTAGPSAGEESSNLGWLIAADHHLLDSGRELLLPSVLTLLGLPCTATNPAPRRSSSRSVRARCATSWRCSARPGT